MLNFNIYNKNEVIKNQSKDFFKQLKTKEELNLNYYTKNQIKKENEEDKINTFNYDIYFENHKANKLGNVIIHTNEIGSTQKFCKENDINGLDGAVMVADVQTEGKGRRSNKWISPIGCLMFSLCTNIKLNKHISPAYLNYVVSIGIVNAVQELTKIKFKIDEIDFKIKWPNDLYANGEKIAGMLINSSIMNDNMKLIIGVGLNLTNEKPTLCLKDVLMNLKHDETACFNYLKEELLAKIMNHTELALNIFENEGFNNTKLEKIYLENWLHSNQEIKIECNEEFDIQKDEIVIIKGISNNGFLLAESKKNGEEIELQPDGNSLDMLNGLIKMKK